MELEEALATIKRLEKRISKQDKELEKFDDLQVKTNKLETELKKFEKENAETVFKLQEKEKIELLKTLDFDEKHFNKLCKLTKDTDEADLKKELADGSYDIFKVKKDALHVEFVDAPEKKQENKKEKLSDTEQVEQYMLEQLG